MIAVAKTAENAILILQALSRLGTATAVQLSEAVELNRTVVHRLLVTLEKHDLVRASGSVYRLGFGLLPLADAVEINIRSASRPELQQLADDIGESSVLMVAAGLDGIHVDQSFSRRDVGPQVRFPAGFRSPLTAAGHGRAILAFADEWVVSQSLERVPEEARDRIAALLVEAKNQGWAESKDELRSGFSGLAVPICDPSGKAIASIGIVSPTSRYPESAELIDLTSAAARRIEAQLFGRAD